MRMNCLIVLVCCHLNAVFSNVEFREVSFEEGVVLAGQENKPLFIYFSADWCMPCEWMEENTFADHNNSRIINNHFIALKFDVDDPLCKGLVQRFDVQSLPTILFLDVDGKSVLKVEKSVGVQPMFLTCRKILDRHLQGVQPEEETISVPTYTLEEPALPVESQSPMRLAAEEANDTEEADFNGEYDLDALPPSPSMEEEDYLTAPRSAERYTLVLGRHREFGQAVKEVNGLERLLGREIRLVKKKKDGKITYVLLLGLYANYEEAVKQLDLLQIKGVKGWVKKQ